MEELLSTAPIGRVIRERYIVEDLLGKGGFSAVYLVRDARVKQNLFALKEVVDPEKKDRTRFLFEGELLRRLEHRALPRVYRTFEDEAQRRAYMLMDYIAGPNLEMLRNEQPGKRFSLPRVLTIMAPIMDAAGYLHKQDPPIIHRDIKPSNIICPVSGDEAVLVDFGIAKEFNPESTTTAVRYCTPGFGAPEQYRIGTNTRTDIYGLAATLYTLLTGVTPTDALYRMTCFGMGEADPLDPINKHLPSIPQHIADAIHRALAVNSNDRFATVDEFWQALNAPIDDPATSPTLPGIPIVSKKPAIVPQQLAKVSSAATVYVKALPRRRSRKRFMLLALILVALLTSASIGAGIWLYNASHPASHPTAQMLNPGPYPTVTAPTSPPTRPTTVSKRPSKATPSPTTIAGQHPGAHPTPTSIPTSTPTKGPGSTPTPDPTASPTPSLTPTSTPTSSPTPFVYPNVAGNYNGTIDDTTQNITATMALSIQQTSGQGGISGTFTVGPQLQGSGHFTGRVTTAKYIHFTVEPRKNSAPLYFYGWVQSDGSLKGQYCSINEQKQCDAAAGDAGTWNVGPPTSALSVFQTSIQKIPTGWQDAIGILLEWGGAIFFLLVALLLMIYSLQRKRAQ